MNQVESLTKEVRSIIAEIAEMEEEEIKGDSNFVEDLGFDSMMALEILARLEKQYKIKIPEEELVKLADLNQTVALVKRYLK